MVGFPTLQIIPPHAIINCRGVILCKNEIEVTLRPDSKGRISLSKLSPDGVTSYRGHWDKKHNSIVLKPYIDVPAEEAWILKNPEALKS
jgi:hypothetical protein